MLILSLYLPTPLPSPSPNLADIANHFQISESYFSSILNSQALIFSTIVLLLVGLSYLFTTRSVRSQISEEVKKMGKDLGEENKKDIEQKIQEGTKHFIDRFGNYEEITNGIRGEIYRAVGKSYEAQSDWPLAFLWSLRAAKYFFLSKDEVLTRILLGRTQASLAQITDPSNIASNDIGEYYEITNRLDNKYKIEKELLDKTLTKLLDKKIL